MQNREFILGVDVDDVIMNYTAGLRRFVAESKNIPEDSIPDPDSWNFSNWPFSDRDDFLKYHTGAVDAGMFETAPVMPGASEVLWRLNDLGIYIRIVTACFVGKGRHALAGSSRFLWLDKENIPFKDICFIPTKTDVYADLWIDDSPKHIEAFNEAGLDVIVFDALYNRHVTGTARVKSWYEAEDIIVDRFVIWEEKYDSLRSTSME